MRPLSQTATEALTLADGVPLVGCDARRRASGQAVLPILVTYVAGHSRPGTREVAP